MAIGPIEITGMVTRTQDYSAMKQNENNKVMVDQGHFQLQVDKKTQEKSTQVNHADDSDYQEKKYDAKEKGNNQYAGDGGKKRTFDRNEKTDRGGTPIRPGGFDIKI